MPKRRNVQPVPGEARPASATAKNGAKTIKPKRKSEQESEFWIPPGSDAHLQQDAINCFEGSLDTEHWCPDRLVGQNYELIHTVNDWHFAMLNDTDRNWFFWHALETVVDDKVVLDIGSGSGLLSMMAARLGARRVVAIEGNTEMVRLAEQNLKRNGQEEQVRLIHNLSNRVKLKADERADVLVSETLGALMLGEGTLNYIVDARKRLLKPGATIIPAGGRQFVVLIESPEIASISSISSGWNGFDLGAIDRLQDTATLLLTKTWGFRLNSIASTRLCDPVQLFEVDFHTDTAMSINQQMHIPVKITHSGKVHAVVAFWEVWSDKDKKFVMSTDPEHTKGQPWGFARDMQWGQGLQLCEDPDETAVTGIPKPVEVEEGETLYLVVRFNSDRSLPQFHLSRRAEEEALTQPTAPCDSAVDVVHAERGTPKSPQR